jgi:N-acetylglutamate synthase-like GNAT family acetyltransferase
MKEPRIRAATADDVSAITQIVGPAYQHYIARMGKPPGPMLNDYSARVSQGVVWVLEEGTVIAAIIVLLPTTDYLLLDDIAVSPARQGLGLGTAARFAEAEALRLGYSEIRLYTHQTINASTLQSVMKRRDAARRPAMTASSCASSFADNDFVRQL